MSSVRRDFLPSFEWGSHVALPSILGVSHERYSTTPSRNVSVRVGFFLSFYPLVARAIILCTIYISVVASFPCHF